MAATTDLPSFDAVIKAERLRKKNENLAAEIFGRKSKTSSIARSRKSDAPPSLASRIGVSKPLQRSHSLTPKTRPTIHSPRIKDPRNPVNGRPTPFSPAALNRIAARLNQNGNSKGPETPNAEREMTVSQTQEEVSIRGIAAPEGPFTVVGSNFAPGTTAADIEAALMSTGGDMVHCKILAASPTVVAEMVFTEKANADRVIATFNNRKADGRLLHVYLKTDGDSISSKQAMKSPPPAPPVVPEHRAEMAQPEPTYDTQREQSDRQRRHAEPAYQDGSYGFGSRADPMDIDMDNRRNVTGSGYDHRVDHRRPSWRDNSSYGARNDGYRNRDPRSLYSDDLYRQGRGRGYR